MPNDDQQHEDTTADGQGVLVLLCTYNELENLPQVVSQIWEALPAAHILVIDDNSPDGTGRWVREHEALDKRLFLMRRAGKQGLGTALKAGIQWCLASSLPSGSCGGFAADEHYSYLINLDADLSHPPAVLPLLLAACRSSAKEINARAGHVAVGSRYIAGGGFQGLAFYRRWMSRLLNAYARRKLELPLTDCSGSLRCYSRTALECLALDELQCEGYGFLEELLVYLHAAGVHFCEVPFVFSARAGGHSKLSLGDAWGAIAVIHRLGAKQDARPQDSSQSGQT